MHTFDSYMYSFYTMLYILILNGEKIYHLVNLIKFSNQTVLFKNFEYLRIQDIKGKILLKKKLILANHFDISIVLEISVEDKFNCNCISSVRLSLKMIIMQNNSHTMDLLCMCYRQPHVLFVHVIRELVILIFFSCRKFFLKKMQRDRQRKRERENLFSNNYS